MRVLYVDDDRVNSLLLSEACRFASGVDVQTADSGSEALEIASQWRPDLLVIGSHGHGAFMSAALGSVSARVLASTKAPVLIIR